MPPTKAAKAAKAAPKPDPEMPHDFQAALAANDEARRTYDTLPPGRQREYLEWLIEAKRPQTRAQRIAQAVEWLGEGKSRHWKYQDR